MKSLLVKLLLKINAPLLYQIRLELKKLEDQIRDNRNENRIINEEIAKILKKQEQIKDISQANYDNLGYLTRELFELRKRPGYEQAFEGNPLISVRIATYNRAEKLINVAISSVLKQTYQNFEIVVVGDHCTDDTEKRINKLNDKRIRFYNLPNRVDYPKDKVKKWQSVGVHAKNTAADMARGQWIATLDDDDEFTPDQLKKLIEHAKSTHCELVYGASIQKNITTGKEKRLWSFPPERGMFTFHSAIYMKELDSIFKSDYKAWVLDEVHDWALCRRMMESGVKISATEDVVGLINMVPALHSRKDY